MHARDGGKNKERSINQEGERSMIHNFSPYGEGSYLGGVNPNFFMKAKSLETLIIDQSQKTLISYRNLYLHFSSKLLLF